jgi:hypothetical protein
VCFKYVHVQCLDTQDKWGVEVLCVCYGGWVVACTTYHSPFGGVKVCMGVLIVK